MRRKGYLRFYRSSFETRFGRNALGNCSGDLLLGADFRQGPIDETKGILKTLQRFLRNTFLEKHSWNLLLIYTLGD